jgi:hypothetical protein
MKPYSVCTWQCMQGTAAQPLSSVRINIDCVILLNREQCWGSHSLTQVHSYCLPSKPAGQFCYIQTAAPHHSGARRSYHTCGSACGIQYMQLTCPAAYAQLPSRLHAEAHHPHSPFKTNNSCEVCRTMSCECSQFPSRKMSGIGEPILEVLLACFATYMGYQQQTRTPPSQ